jgi:4-diphosphocytidyl-2C-methyl-D-erythritol kinase
MALYDVPAPAKLNLFLHVTGRRPDGYHELQTVFRFIDLCDTLDFDLRADGRIERDGPGLQGLPAEDDLVIRAARALQEATSTRHGAQIRYTKRIPSGAGLGGGSSDAATTLIALNRLWGTGLDRPALMRMARPLGADVPVFVFGASAFAEGIGDLLTEISLPERAYLVFRPHGGVATANVFSSPGLTRDTRPVIISVFADWQTANAQKQATKHGFLETGKRGCELFGRNDLEPVVMSEYENVRRMAESLQKLNFHVRMTGSGSCFFVEFDSLESAARSQREISSKMLVGRSEGQLNRLHGEGAQHESLNAVIEDMWLCHGLSEHPLRHW